MAKFNSPNSKQYLKNLKKTEIPSIFLLLGEENAEKEKFINKICKMKFSTEYEKYHFRAENDDLMAFLDYSSSSMMFTSEKVAVFYNADKSLKSKNDKALFEETMTSLPEGTLVFLCISANKQPKIFTTDYIQSVIFWKPFENELHQYIMESFRKKNISISPVDIKALMLLTGRSVEKIDKAIERLSLAAEDNSINLDIIRANITDERNISIFDFIDALFLKNKKSINLFLRMKEEDIHELVMLQFVKKELEKLEIYHIAMKNGNSSSEALSKAGIYSKSTERFIKTASLFNYNKICSLQQHLYLTELKLKSSSYDNNLSNPFTDLIFEICS